MKTLFKLLVSVFALMLLAGCAAEGAEPTEVPPTETVAATEAAEPTELAATEPEKIPFEDYEYRYTDERDRAWEEDVVFLAKTFLGEYPMKGHPLLNNKEVMYFKPNNFAEPRNLYQKDLRDAFVADLETLIQNIPVLTDMEIVYELHRIVAKLSDLHSYVDLPVNEIFVFMVEPFYSDTGMELRIVRIPAQYQNALFGELVSINGVPVDEVLDRLGRYISHEWEFGKMYRMTHTFHNGLIMRKEALQIAGIVGAEDTTAKLEIITEQGERIVAEVPAVTSAVYKQTEKAMGDWFSSGLISYDDYWAINYYLRYEEENDLCYIRFNRLQEMTNYRFFAFLEDIKKQVTKESCKKIVVDLRLDGGGTATQMHEDLIAVLRKSTAEQIYILIDAASYSEAILLPVDLRQNLENAVIVGTPGGQGPNFFASCSYNYLPNSGHMFATSTAYFLGWPDYEYETLMPDITVYQTLEDYKQGIDTVMEYVRNAAVTDNG